jgi:hypothetical protein
MFDLIKAVLIITKESTEKIISIKNGFVYKNSKKKWNNISDSQIAHKNS